MCGRFALAVTDVEIRRHFNLDELPEWQPRYNIAPSQDVPVVHQSGSGRVCEAMRWGLVPHWSKGPDKRYAMINARAETVASKPAYREPFRQGRCLVPASGYFEWRKTNDVRQPFFLRPQGATLFAFAGLWDEWRGEGGMLRSFTLITTQANPESAQIHERMPVMINQAQYDLWLQGQEPEVLLALLGPYAGALDVWAVSGEVNNPRHEGPELIQTLK